MRKVMKVLFALTNTHRLKSWIYDAKVLLVDGFSAFVPHSYPNKIRIALTAIT